MPVTVLGGSAGLVVEVPVVAETEVFDERGGAALVAGVAGVTGAVPVDATAGELLVTGRVAPGAEAPRGG